VRSTYVPVTFKHKNTALSLKQIWQTTSRPTGYKRKETFRDMPLTRRKFSAQFIDAFDATCIERGCKRSELWEDYRNLTCADFFEKLYANQKEEDLAGLSPLLRHTSDLRNLVGSCLKLEVAPRDLMPLKQFY
jgi:hypothetical protein